MLTHSLIIAVVTQFAAIEGQVVDARTHTAIPFARVELSHSKAPVDLQYSNDDGRFHFKRVVDGAYTISVHSTGYESSAVEVDSGAAVSSVIVELVRKRSSQTGVPAVVSVNEYLVPQSARK